LFYLTAKSPDRGTIKMGMPEKTWPRWVGKFLQSETAVEKNDKLENCNFVIVNCKSVLFSVQLDQRFL